ncbi:unnamed protein product [Pseudo-nitzschia multistriata]|uniref:Uncharacterized protein n=1 Tax=Pseudo-nitzschia multistriata TaxID=183589 RepID=A0A448YZW2_9STRA|nr:unnamed protein product [Pseudo-nitzschia multistriata]
MAILERNTASTLVVPIKATVAASRPSSATILTAHMRGREVKTWRNPAGVVQIIQRTGLRVTSNTNKNLNNSMKTSSKVPMSIILCQEKPRAYFATTPSVTMTIKTPSIVLTKGSKVLCEMRVAENMKYAKFST